MRHTGSEGITDGRSRLGRMVTSSPFEIRGMYLSSHSVQLNVVHDNCVIISQSNKSVWVGRQLYQVHYKYHLVSRVSECM